MDDCEATSVQPRQIHFALCYMAEEFTPLGLTHLRRVVYNIIKISHVTI